MTTSNYDTQALARRLGSDDETERQQAQTELRSLIASDAGRITRFRKALLAIRIACLLLIVALYTNMLISGNGSNNGLICLISLTCTGILPYLISLPVRRAANRIASLDLPQAVGPLIDVLAVQDLLPSAPVKFALIRLLPRLRPTDAELLTPAQRKSLVHFLRRDEMFPYNGRLWGKDLKIAILRALEQIGDEKAIPTVEKTARAAHDSQVRRAAQECLPYLQARVQHTRIEQTLLRASAPAQTPDVLLRAASAAASASETELLRATRGPDTTP